ncbi:MAG: phosphatase [Oscillospiraceae bacterium]|jgi:putative hydrolase|nr:phosphatase [Oscillospiraceae bacterium]
MLPPFELDVHTHTIVSGHAYGTIREMAHAASEKGLKLLGFAEHGPGVPGTCDPVYFAALEHAPRSLCGVELLYGCEINVLEGGLLSLPERYLNMIDYGVVGIHKICYTDQGREQNTENLISCMKHPKVFFVSHPDDDQTPLDYERLVSAAREYHVALEVNSSSFAKPHLRVNCVENYKTMLPLCEKHHVPILVNSDAHDPLEVAQTSAARALLEELHFDPSLILSLSAPRFKEFIGM